LTSVVDTVIAESSTDPHITRTAIHQGTGKLVAVETRYRRTGTIVTELTTGPRVALVAQPVTGIHIPEIATGPWVAVIACYLVAHFKSSIVTR